MIGRPAAAAHDAEGGGQGHGRCAVDGCASAPCGRHTIALGESADCRGTLALCRWPALILTGDDERLTREYRCPHCAGPVRAEQLLTDGAPERYYTCAATCSDTEWHEDVMVDVTLERLEAAYKAGDL